MAKAIDLSGQDFGFLHVIERDFDAQRQHASERQAWWKCECKACGKIKSFRSSVIKKSKSCGCVKNYNPLTEKEKAHLKEMADKNSLDLVGQRFSRLLVLSYAPEQKQVYYNGHHKRTWLCQCDCGNQCYVTTENLRRGDTPSCGCITKENQRKHLKDLSGQRFGHLLVLSFVGTINGNTKYKVRCDCGKEYEVFGNNLTQGNTTSCGCVKESHGETKIRELLTQNNIKFINQKIFPGFKFNDTNGTPKFDFYLPDFHTCIEYDGEQHFSKIFTFDTDETFNQRKQHDIEKNNYCLNNNITLIRIPYTHYSSLSLNDLLPNTSNFIIKKE